MTPEEILDYARGHDWSWCIFAGTDQDCHGRICKCVTAEVSAVRWRKNWSEEEAHFWHWLIDRLDHTGFEEHPDKLKLSLLDWCLRDKELAKEWQRIQQEEATARFAQARATAYKVATNGQMASALIKAKIKEQKRAAHLAKRRLKYHQKKAATIMLNLLDKPLQAPSSKIEIDGKDFHPHDLLRKHSERIQAETVERRQDRYE
jgi:hypothetical protein